MFGNLIESNSHKGDNARKGWFFLGTLSVYTLLFLAIGVGSIYAYNTHIETQNLELVSLIAPVESPEVQPAPMQTVPKKSAGGGSDSPKIAVVKTQPVMTTMDPRQLAGKAMVSAPITELPVGTRYKIGTPGPGDNLFGDGVGRTNGNGSGRNGSGGGSDELSELTNTPPPVMRTAPPQPPAPKRVKTMGVVNGMATSLPKPVYSAIAKAAGIQGTVTVQVLIDENGKVISARAVNGHPLLSREAVQAAYQARFTPTLLSQQPVKVSGIITYNFVR